MAQVEADKAACRSAGYTKHTQMAVCINAAEQRFASVYPNRDLLNLRLATRLALAERQDRGEITAAQAELEFARVGVQLGSEESSRAVNRQMANAMTDIANPVPVMPTFRCRQVGFSTVCN